MKSKDPTGATLVDAVVIIHADGSALTGPEPTAIPKDVTVSPDPHSGKYTAELPVGLNYDVFISRAGFRPHCIKVYMPRRSRRVELNLTLKIVSAGGCMLYMCDQ